MPSKIAYASGGDDGDFPTDGDQRYGPFLQRASEITGDRCKFTVCLLFVITSIIIIAFMVLFGFSIALAEVLPLIHPHENSCTSLQPSSALAPAPPAVENQMPCGNSSEEARAKDCIFDLTVAAWLPYDCYDEEISKEFMALGPWDFYESNSTEWDLRDAPASQRFLLPDVDAISDSLESMWTSRRYHIIHCLYAWKIKDRAVLKGKRTEGTLMSYHHTEHCAIALSNTSIPVDAIMTRVEISFPAC
jgi:hypothetical protein